MAIDLTQIELTLEQKQLLATQAEQTGRPWAEVLSEALRHCSRVPSTVSGNPQSFYDSMRDVIGTVKAAPPDLSTNPTYLEGLGRDCDAGVG
jgi:hypothetical protein